VTGPPLVALEGVTRVYGGGGAAVEALRGVDLHVTANDFVAIMGPSGSGKSTAMHIVGCLDLPSAGSYRFLGVDVAGLSRNQRALLRRRYIGFVFQQFHLLPRTTAIENVELPLLYRMRDARERRARAARALAAVGLAGRESHTPAELSGGEQQRVAIARAIVTDPILLLADEPTGNLDSRSGRTLMELLAELKGQRELTVMMVTHDAAIAGWAQRTIHFDDGRIRGEAAGGGGAPC
jgi:putative ABC transport system ATP-binding protein